MSLGYSLDKDTLEIKNKIWDLIHEVEDELRKTDPKFRYHISQSLRDVAVGYEDDRVNYYNKGKGLGIALR